MARKRDLPDEAVLKRWYLHEKLTFRAMAERWAEDPNGTRCTPAAFAAMCATYEDWYVPRNRRHVGTDYWPWLNVRPEHNDMHDAQMLRLFGRRAAGDKLSAKLDNRLNKWLRTLREENAVIAYKLNTQQGWWHVTREAADGNGIVRWPEEYRKRHLSAVPVVADAG